MNKDGQIKWEFGGSDIFLSIDNEEKFKLDDEGILLPLQVPQLKRGRKSCPKELAEHHWEQGPSQKKRRS